MKFRKLAHYLPEIEGYTHATCPTWHDGVLYFSPRVAYTGRSQIWAAEFDPRTLEMGSPYLLLTEGEPGAFDDSGAMVSCIVADSSKVEMYYIGWNVGIRVPFRNSIGLATLNGGRWRKASGPVLDRSAYDPYFTASCWVLTNPYRMYYLTCTGWEWGSRHNYHIAYATTDSTHRWNPTGLVMIPHTQEDWAISRPCVWEDDGFHMLYSHRGDEYQLGYASSVDGIHWERDDGAIEVERTDFDDRAQCYPMTFEYDGQRFLLWNGNNYGRTGFALGVQDD